MIQGMSGIMDLTGEPDGQPQKIGVAFADIFTGLYSVVAMFDCMTGVLANQALNFLASGSPPTRMGNKHPNIAPYQTFATSDGHLIIAVGNDSQFTRLCKLLSLEILSDDERFNTVKIPIKFSDATLVTDKRSPKLGEHNS